MTYHLLSKEIFLQGTFASDVVLQGYVSVRTESTGQDRNVAKNGLPDNQGQSQIIFTGKTQIYRGLSRMLDILYSKF